MKHVFVCGLHRSGTTILAKSIGDFENCTLFRDTGVLMDEGQFLQNVYPADIAHGGAGRFGFKREAHLTEASSVLTADAAERLRSAWQRHWDPDKSIRVEKTPGNLLMTRFLQAVFPSAYFIIIRRDPVAVALATQKWSRTSLNSLFDHWLRCHDIFTADKPHLEHCYQLTYEDYTSDPQKYMFEIATFLGLTVRGGTDWPTIKNYNDRYLDQWRSMTQNPLYRSYCLHLIAKYGDRFSQYGYSFSTESALTCAATSKGKCTMIAGRFICSLADACTVPLRLEGSIRYRTKRLLKRI